MKSYTGRCFDSYKFTDY